MIKIAHVSVRNFRDRCRIEFRTKLVAFIFNIGLLKNLPAKFRNLPFQTEHCSISVWDQKMIKIAHVSVRNFRDRCRIEFRTKLVAFIFNIGLLKNLPAKFRNLPFQTNHCSISDWDQGKLMLMRK